VTFKHLASLHILGRISVMAWKGQRTMHFIRANKLLCCTAIGHKFKMERGQTSFILVFHLSADIIIVIVLRLAQLTGVWWCGAEYFTISMAMKITFINL
jgi:hypothetical protein